MHTHTHTHTDQSFDHQINRSMIGFGQQKKIIKPKSIKLTLSIILGDLKKSERNKKKFPENKDLME